MNLGLVGWVRNLRDGGVEAVAEGPREALEALAEWARQGPPLARVDSRELTWSAATGEFDAFVILRP